MKTLKAIKAELKRNHERRQAIAAEVAELEAAMEAVRQGRSFFNKEYLQEVKETRKAIEPAIIELYNEDSFLKVESLILQENARAALFYEAFPVILAACQKYNGKQYGEATKQKIREEVKKSGYSFYFSGTESYRIGIHELNNEGYFTPACVEVEAIALNEKGQLDSFVTKENKLNIANVNAKPRSKYKTGTKAAAKKVLKEIAAYKAALEALNKQRSALADILPENVKEPEYIRGYDVTF